MTISTPTTPGQILTSAYVNNNINSGLVHINTTTYTNAASVPISSVFSSQYKNYKIIGSHNPTNSLAGFYMRLRASGTDQIGANYQYTSARLYNNSAFDTSGNLATEMTLSNGGLASFPHGFEMNIFDPFGNTSTPVIYDAVNFEASVAMVRWWAAGGYKANYSADGFTIYPSAGTTWTGSITIMGYRNP